MGRKPIQLSGYLFKINLVAQEHYPRGIQRDAGSKRKVCCALKKIDEVDEVLQQDPPAL